MATGAPGTPEATRRTTRSVSHSTPLKPTPHETRSIPSLPHDLLFPGEPTTLESLLSSLPGRRSQILDLLSLIGSTNSPMLPLLLYGGASTGKTSAVLRTFYHLNRPFVYASCRSCYCPKILFDSVLNQLLLRTKNKENGYSTANRCEKESDFINLLRDALVLAIDAIREGKKKKTKKGSKEGVKDGDGEMVYLIFDNVEVMRNWGKSSGLLSLLFKLYDILRIPEVGFIYISSVTPDAYYSMTGSVEPIPVFFPNYTVDDLNNIFMKDQANPELYSSFLSVVLKPFCGITRRVDELSISLSSLYQKYCEPLADLSAIPDKDTKRRLFNHFQPYFKASLNEVFEVPSWSPLETGKDERSTKIAHFRKLGGKAACKDLDIHMSLSAKYLILSAFLASRNPATLDAALFDSTGGSNSRKRKRKGSQTSIDQREEAAQEVLIKGPGSFPLERLLAIFQCITSVTDDATEEGHLGDGMATESGNTGLMSNVLLQLSTLCNANFISKSGSCPLEGSSRYRSMIDEDMAMKVARSIRFPLSNYLYRK